MAWLNLLCRILVGSLFIFSGLIKLNDPYGTVYKLDEYFEVFAADISPLFLQLLPTTLFLAIFISSFEVILGVAILLYYRMRITMWVSLLLILFFTFLTFYSHAFDKVKECGCFGTAIKLTAKQSFYKDLILLGLIAILFFFRNHLNAGFNNLKGNILMILVTIGSFSIGVYSKNHLPYFDTTPYKSGNNLNVLTKPKAHPRYEWILEKNGKEYSFDDEHYPTDTTYKYKRHILLTDSTLLVPEISGFRIYNDFGEFTEEGLKGKKVFVVVSDPLKAGDHCDKDCMKKLNEATKFLESRGFKTMILTIPDSEHIFENYRNEVQLRGDYFYMDDTVLKAMIRSNPGMILLEDGKILKKWHYNDIPSIDYLKTRTK